MTEAEQQALLAIATKHVQERQSIGEGTRRYSHEEWAVFYGLLAQQNGLFPIHQDKDRKDFLVYPAREETGSRLAKKLLTKKIADAKKHDVHWTELVLSSPDDHVRAKLSEADMQKFWDKSSAALYNVVLLISIKADHNEELRGDKLKATVSLWCELVRSMSLYHKDKGHKGKPTLKFVVLIADTLQAYNELTDVTVANIDDKFRDKTLQEKWRAAGKHWRDEAEVEFQRLTDVANDCGVTLEISYKHWEDMIDDEVIKLRDGLEEVSRQGQASIEGNGFTGVELAQQKFTLAVNHKAHRHEARFTEPSESVKQEIAIKMKEVTQLYHDKDSAVIKKVKELLSNKDRSSSQPTIMGYSHDNFPYKREGYLTVVKGHTNELEAEVKKTTAAQLFAVPAVLPQNFSKRMDLQGKVIQKFSPVPKDDSLKKQDDNRRVMVCHGYSGVGKTSVAIDFAHHYSGAYDVVVWWDSEARGTFNQRLAELLELDLTGLMPLQQIEALQQKLKEQKRILFVFDNVSSQGFTFVNDFTKGLACDVIITAVGHCPANCSMKVEHLSVPCFSQEQAETLFKNIVGHENKDKRVELLKAVKMNPLWITIIAKTIVMHYGGNVSLYPPIQLKGKTKPFKIIQHGVFDEAAMPILHFFSYLSTMPLDGKLLFRYMRDQHGLTKEQTYQLCSRLVQVGLLREEGDTLQMHADIQKAVRSLPFGHSAVAKEQQQERLTYVFSLAEYFSAYIGKSREMSTKLRELRHCLPHAMVLIQHLRLNKQSDTKVQHTKARICSAIATVCSSLGLHEERKKHLKQALEIMKDIKPVDHLRMARLTANLGDMHYSLGELDENLSCARKAVAYVDAAQAFNLSDFARCQAGLGRALLYKGLCEEAKVHLRHAESIYYIIIHLKLCQSDLRPGYARVLNALGLVEQDMGALEKSIRYFIAALDFEEKIFGDNNIVLFDTLINLANSCRMLDKSDQALQYISRAEAILEAHDYDEEHIKYGKWMETKALIYERQGRFIDACPLFNKALIINLRAYGEDNINVARTHFNLSDNLAKREKYAEALALLAKVIPVFIAHYGEAHDRVSKAQTLEVQILLLQASQEERLQESISVLHTYPGTHFPSSSLQTPPSSSTPSSKKFAGLKQGFLL